MLLEIYFGIYLKPYFAVLFMMMCHALWLGRLPAPPPPPDVCTFPFGVSQNWFYFCDTLRLYPSLKILQLDFWLQILESYENKAYERAL